MSVSEAFSVLFHRNKTSATQEPWVVKPSLWSWSEFFFFRDHESDTIHRKLSKRCTHPNVHCTAALFTTARTGKQSKCTATEGWIKMWYICTVEYYSAIKKKQIVPCAVTWMDLEIVILSEVRKRNTNIWYCLYMESKNNGTNEPICKT